MSGKKLANAPLKEAIFEVLWGAIDKTGISSDKEYDLAQGRFEVQIREHFPIYKRLIPANAPFKIFHQPVHQFWKDHLSWPVIQLGPGIMSVNEVDKGYIWDDFRANVAHSTKVLLNSYLETLSFEKLSLRYIDSVDLPANASLADYINDNFRTNITNSFDMPGEIIGVNCNQVFNGFDNSKIHLNIQTAKNNVNDKLAIVWITLIEKDGTFTFEDILKWVDSAHDVSSDLFVKTLSQKFYATFDR